MSTTYVHLNNQSAKVSAEQVGVLAAGLRTYAAHVSAHWGLGFVQIQTGAPVWNAWEFNIVDSMPDGAPANALGFHELVGDKVVAYVSTELTLEHGPFGMIMPSLPPVGSSPGFPETYVPGSLSEVLSHELAEALVDPFVNRYAFDAATGLMWLVEVGDHADAYRYAINVAAPIAVQRMIVQDFTLPSFYDNEGAPPYSMARHVSGRFTVDKGCYAYRMAAGGVSTVGMDRLGGSDES